MMDSPVQNDDFLIQNEAFPVQNEAFPAQNEASGSPFTQRSTTSIQNGAQTVHRWISTWLVVVSKSHSSNSEDSQKAAQMNRVHTLLHIFWVCRTVGDTILLLIVSTDQMENLIYLPVNWHGY